MLPALVLGALLSCKTAISDPPRAPRHMLTPEQRDLVLERLNAEIPSHKFTDVTLHRGVVTVKWHNSDTPRECRADGFGTVRQLIETRNGACRLYKRFLLVINECLERPVYVARH